jgi:hypothetical protein
MGDIDMDRIIQEYQDRIDAGEPEPFDSFLPTPPPPPPEPNGFFPGIDPRDYQDMGFEDMDFTNFGNMDFSNLPKLKYQHQQCLLHPLLQLQLIFQNKHHLNTAKSVQSTIIAPPPLNMS